MDSISAIIMFLVILAQGVERFFFARQVMEERKELMLAFLSKDATEMAIAFKTGKEQPEKEIVDNDVDISQATDEEFDKAIETLNK